ncbi:hypothetical protein ACFZAV_43375 [Streptomyces sp. NPDC008343]|uniref:hypothetical protein n=1 Tax=Streptomyces sp. NPDC008343 TaxID=3364828 RepID=UPI0036E2D263
MTLCRLIARPVALARGCSVGEGLLLREAAGPSWRIRGCLLEDRKVPTIDDSRFCDGKRVASGTLTDLTVLSAADRLSDI